MEVGEVDATGLEVGHVHVDRGEAARSKAAAISNWELPLLAQHDHLGPRAAGDEGRGDVFL